MLLVLLLVLLLTLQLFSWLAITHSIDQFKQPAEQKASAVSSRAAAAIDAPRPVIFVGNNWQGTITVIDRESYQPLGHINGIPDAVERLEEIRGKFIGRMLFMGIRHLVGEGNDQYVDDMYSSPGGQRLVVSRPSFADVVALNINTGEIIWRFPVDGARSDHMALSPDGKQVAVSASTGDVVHVIDIQTGEEIARFPTGDAPHENVYSKDGSKLFHASIGNVYTPLDLKGGGLWKGRRRFLEVDTSDYRVLQSFDIKDKLIAAGLKDLSPAIRPMAHTRDEKTFYFQLSFLHGLIEYDMASGAITRKVDLPKHTTLPKTAYVNDSAHHGIAMSGDDRTLCVAGTMDDYVAMIDVASFDYKLLTGLGKKPYWAVTDKTGKYCFVSWSVSDTLSIIDYATKEEIARIDVGHHPQRVREGFVPAAWVE